LEKENGKLRDECRNGEIFFSLKEAQIVIEKWRVEYNTRRPHSALGYRPPAPGTFSPQMAALRSPTAPCEPSVAPPREFSLTSAGTKKPGQVTQQKRARSCSVLKAVTISEVVVIELSSRSSLDVACGGLR